MDRQEILLKEYETCQSHNNALGNQSWISISILITVNLLVLTQVVSEIMLKSVPIMGYSKLTSVAFLSFVMIFILWIFRRWDKRINFIAWLNNENMREIEAKLRMSKNWRAYGLDLKYHKQKKFDELLTLHPDIAAMVNRLSIKHPKLGFCKKLLTLFRLRKQEQYESQYMSPTTERFFRFDYIYYILIAIWLALLTVEILIYRYPIVRDWLFN